MVATNACSTDAPLSSLLRTQDRRSEFCSQVKGILISSQSSISRMVLRDFPLAAGALPAAALSGAALLGAAASGAVTIGRTLVFSGVARPNAKNSTLKTKYRRTGGR